MEPTLPMLRIEPVLPMLRMLPTLRKLSARSPLSFLTPALRA